MITAEEKTNRYGYHYVYYRCTKKKRNTVCRQKYVNAEDLEAQIVTFPRRIHVHDQLLGEALGYLKEESKEDAHIDFKGSLKKALGYCEKKLSNLNQMRLGDLVADEEYLQEKKMLIAEKLKLEKSLNEGNTDKERSDERTRGAFLFASEAIERFQKGTPDEKRSVFQQIGSNFSLRDKKLFIHAEKPFQIIEEGLKALQMKTGRLEPPKNESVKGEIGRITSCNSTLVHRSEGC